jgi:hypothetical protein
MCVSAPLAAGSIGEREIRVLSLQYLDDRVASVSACVVHWHASWLADGQEVGLASWKQVDWRIGHGRLDAEDVTFELITIAKYLTRGHGAAIDSKAALRHRAGQ